MKTQRPQGGYEDFENWLRQQGFWEEFFDAEDGDFSVVHRWFIWQDEAQLEMEFTP